MEDAFGDLDKRVAGDELDVSGRGVAAGAAHRGGLFGGGGGLLGGGAFIGGGPRTRGTVKVGEGGDGDVAHLSTAALLPTAVHLLGFGHEGWGGHGGQGQVGEQFLEGFAAVEGHVDVGGVVGELEAEGAEGDGRRARRTS